MSIRTGLDVWRSHGFSALRGKRVGAIVNPTSVSASDLRHLADLLRDAEGVTLGALFGPEHGLRGEAQYMVPVDDEGRRAHPRWGVPVYSLYGATFDSLTPKPEWLEGLDALVFDIQDVGSRYYTYVYTMALAMKAAAKAKVAFYVLDRPNPIGGAQVEGNLVGQKYRSFVGLYPVPNRHGMTAGELAQFFNEDHRIGCELTVVSCEGWRREQRFDATGLPFVPPSPNMPTPMTALVYPGMCLAEGTNVSEGRGTCRPFEQFGAPWLDSDALIARLEQERLPGVCFRAASFTPTFDKYQGTSCNGAMMHVTDAQVFLPLRTGIAILRACRELGQGAFQWRADAYEFVEDIPAFDLLCGTDLVRRGMDAGWPLDQLMQGFDAEAASFEPVRQRHRLYD